MLKDRATHLLKSLDYKEYMYIFVFLTIPVLSWYRFLPVQE